jgi:hypothetical protein
MKDHEDKSMGITLITEDLVKLDQTYRTLKIHQAFSSQETKLLRFLR